MTVKNFILFVLLGFSGLLNAELPANISPATVESQCNLPAPTNFQVVNIGTTWVDLTWIPSSPGSWHRIKTFETVSGNLVGNIQVPPGILVQRINGLQPNTEYTFKINAICEDGSDSNELTETDATTFIGELIVIGYESSAASVNCTIQVQNGSCTFPMNGFQTGFMVRSTQDPSIKRRFFAGKTTDPSSDALFSVSLKKDNFRESLAIQCDQQDPYALGKKYQVKYEDQVVVEFELSHNYVQDIGVLTCTQISQNFEVVKFVTPPQPNGGFGGGAFNGGSIGALEESHTLVANTMPNPFSDQLNVQLEQFSEAPVQLSLFNLNGQRVLDQSFTGGSETYTLNTAHIPAGFYLLRVDYNGEVQTVKVVKTQ
ncbi:MAG TPA: T9SS type A sorting domain-containing protein [Saprospiraceae bacterium]|nr:T9SS type A sorting domain-containing protein [Saprospiraceae bacterium]